MVRSLYSGVTGMKGHQTRLDVIGNNIANVNTMGFKSSSTTFRDVYYQSLRGASAGNGTRGGVNSSMVGYGSKVSSVDVNMTQSISSTTGNPWDVSIGGEGFFQVQDSEGNIFYTRSGKFGYDSMGYLVDSNGYYVLGTQAQGNKVVGQKPGSSRIQMQIPALNPTQASYTMSLNNIQYTLTASNTTTDGNVAVTFLSDNLPAGVPAQATVTSTGITVKLNKTFTFKSMDELNTYVNDAIVAGNNNKQHPGGTFNLTTSPVVTFPAEGLTGAQICDTPGTNLSGEVTMQRDPNNTDHGTTTNNLQTWGFSFANPPTGSQFSGGGTCDAKGFEVSYADGMWTVKLTIGGKEYNAQVSGGELSSGKIRLRANGATTSTEDYITMVCPNERQLIRMSKEYATLNQDKNQQEQFPPEADGYTFAEDATLGTLGMPNVGEYSITNAQKSDNLGLGGNVFTMQNGTEGGPQTLADISGFKINANGVIEATHNGNLLELGRIDLATFDNPSGLEQVGNTYFANTGNTGSMRIVESGTGGSGALASSTLEMSNVDLSQEFADVITTQRGYQANARMITVSDTLLEELINLKR
jgi:flagellar hook protein FlgE